MVPDLNNYKSHPDKALEVHIAGVSQKALKRYNSPLVKWAALFHDLGKINPNFQKKIEPSYKGEYVGYDEHAYLSAWSWLCFFEQNVKSHIQLRQNLNGDMIYFQIILVLIAKHHGNLPNFGKLLKDEPLERLKKFLKANTDLPITSFLNENLDFQHQPFRLSGSEILNKLLIFTQKEKWQQNALHYFFETQFSFAALIEGDKRDAGDKYLDNYYHLETINGNSKNVLTYGLNQKWHSLSSKTAKSELDALRTQIREEAVVNIKKEISKGKRVFTLTAPTGAGKTFTLLSLASAIQNQLSNKSILYALPFLSIIEQVGSIIKDDLYCDLLSVSSKAKNEQVDNLIEKLDIIPEESDFKELLKQDFIQLTFDHPLILTTFVQLFETLLSNRNSTLLKLPNFSNRIFLIDEIQALPPRLYIFFTAWLTAFCEKWDSFAILSTATMPKMDFETKMHIDESQKPEKLFKDYLANQPCELLNYQKFFAASPFNRYRINLANPFELFIDDLVERINEQQCSCLVILNTISDSREVYERLEGDNKNVYLLNTHFIPKDRREKIDVIKAHLEAKEKVILVSTQLIEAGVDIDFPVVFRDLCPLPSLIQSAGRCNRNKKLSELGQVYFFHLKSENGRSGAEKVYRDEAKTFLNFSKKYITNGVEEKELLKVQQEFFQFIAENLTIGDYNIDREKVNLIQLVNEAAFETLGKFKLINENDFGYEFQYYIPENEYDDEYDKAVELLKVLIAAIDFQSKKMAQVQLNNQMRKVGERLITIRTFDKNSKPLASNSEEHFNIKVLADLSLYTLEKGLLHNSTLNSFL